jgi:hypothetical protein
MVIDCIDLLRLCAATHLSYLEHDPSASAAIADGAHRFLHVIQWQDAIDVRPLA